ncbi:MAG: ABC transporter ATP-binding protein [Actinomycetota bacterium]
MLRVTNLVKDYPARGSDRVVHAVRGISFEVERGRALGIVGESGCGKSTTARLVARLEDATGGRIELDGRDVTRASGRELRAIRRRVQMVFQDPHSSLNPRMRVGDALAEVLKVHRLAAGGRAQRARVAELLEMVGLRPAAGVRYPHEFSGGQRQRVGVARALAVEPAVLILDEPVSALDVSVRAEVMNLLVHLREQLDLTYVFISHDLSMVRHISDHIAVMYLGKIVEQGAWDSVSERALHPYTEALYEAVPVPDPDAEGARDVAPVRGEPPDPSAPPPGCSFNTRCPLAEDVCAAEEPPLDELTPGHLAACHVRARELGRAARPGGVPSRRAGSVPRP